MDKVAAAARAFRPKKFTTIVMMLIIWAGVMSALFAGISTDVRNRDYLRGRAQIVSDTLDPSLVTNLRGNQSDLATLDYNHLKDDLQQVRRTNPDIKLAQLITKQKDGSLAVLVDSEIPDSANYLAPGSKLSSQPEAVAGLFSSGEPLTAGPHRSGGNVWVSAYAQVTDPKDGSTLAIISIRTSAVSFYSQVLLYALVPLLLSAIPLLGMIRDVKLQTKQNELMRLKNQFVSIASHELRSPLTGMLWAIQSLSKTGAARLNLEQLSMLGAMYHSAESSLATVNEILDFSIFDRGQAKIQHEVTNVPAVIKQVVATLSLSAREKRLNVESVGKWPRQVYTHGDVAALKRAFMNIFSNAIKYSNDKGSIEIIYHPGNANEHIIAIRDHGIGIPDAEKEKVMSGYYRATNATNVEVHGTGLGMLVTQKIFEQHGGRLWLESKENSGTTVYVALPVAEAEPTNPSPMASNNPSPVQSESADSAPQGQDSPLPGTPSHQPSERG